MTGGTEVATVHGPLSELAKNQTPFWQAYQDWSSTLIIGVPLLAT
jgi:hypothetical protein